MMPVYNAEMEMRNRPSARYILVTGNREVTNNHFLPVMAIKVSSSPLKAQKYPRGLTLKLCRNWKLEIELQDDQTK